MSDHAVQLQQLASTPLAVVRRQVKAVELSRVVPECCGLVWNAVKAQGAKGGRHVAMYLDDTLRVEIGVELLSPFNDQGDVVRSATPAATVATTTHLGPYGGLGAAYKAIRDWCAEHKYRMVGPSWEIYGHWEPGWNADPSKIRTDLFWVVAPA
jgi:effector-binding domain-containing protein